MSRFITNYTTATYTNKTYWEPALKQYPDIQLHLHQFRAVECIKEQDTLLAYAVGSGKSYTMITAAMELKRLGLTHKPMIVVQNSTLNDFARAWHRLYPAAIIYVPQPDDPASEEAFIQEEIERVAYTIAAAKLLYIGLNTSY